MIRSSNFLSNDCKSCCDSSTGAGFQTAILFYEDISVMAGDTAVLDFSFNVTSNNGLYDFMDGTSSSACITFADVLTSDQGYVEFFVHGDATAGTGGTANFITFELSGISVDANSLGIVDIDTRTVAKGTTSHLAFGNSGYVVNTTNTTSNTKTINKNNTYRFRVNVGRDYDFSEIKLVIKFTNL